MFQLIVYDFPIDRIWFMVDALSVSRLLLRQHLRRFPLLPRGRGAVGLRRRQKLPRSRKLRLQPYRLLLPLLVGRLSHCLAKRGDVRDGPADLRAPKCGVGFSQPRCLVNRDEGGS